MAEIVGHVRVIGSAAGGAYEYKAGAFRPLSAGSAGASQGTRVVVLRNGDAGQVLIGHVGLPLTIGDVILTAPSGNVSIEYVIGGRTFISQNAAARIRGERDVEIVRIPPVRTAAAFLNLWLKTNRTDSINIFNRRVEYQRQIEDGRASPGLRG